MVNKPYVGDAVETIGDVVLLADGDILVGQSKTNAGVVKYDYTTEKLDTDFAGGKKTFRGVAKDDLSNYLVTIESIEKATGQSVPVEQNLKKDVADDSNWSIDYCDQHSPQGWRR